MSKPKTANSIPLRTWLDNETKRIAAERQRTDLAYRIATWVVGTALGLAAYTVGPFGPDWALRVW